MKQHEAVLLAMDLTPVPSPTGEGVLHGFDERRQDERMNFSIEVVSGD